MQLNRSIQLSSFWGDALDGKGGGKVGKQSGIKKIQKQKNGKLCRRKRAGEARSCRIRFFGDKENFQPVPALRTVNQDVCNETQILTIEFNM